MRASYVVPALFFFAGVVSFMILYFALNRYSTSAGVSGVFVTDHYAGRIRVCTSYQNSGLQMVCGPWASVEKEH